MSGRTASEAAQRHIQSIRALIGCVTAPILTSAQRFGTPDHPITISLRNGLPVRLRADMPLYFNLAQSYIVVESGESRRDRWGVRELGYAYAYDVGYSVGSVHELISFHWHPEPEQLVRFPHVHLGYGAGDLQHGLDKAHIPTGRLSISNIVRFAVTELGVEPLRADWAELLQAQSGDP